MRANSPARRLSPGCRLVAVNVDKLKSLRLNGWSPISVIRSGAFDLLGWLPTVAPRLCAKAQKISEEPFSSALGYRCKNGI